MMWCPHPVPFNTSGYAENAPQLVTGSGEGQNLTTCRKAVGTDLKIEFKIKMCFAYQINQPAWEYSLWVLWLGGWTIGLFLSDPKEALEEPLEHTSHMC